MTNSAVSDIAKKFNRLSIQISLNGLSFCVLDTVSNDVISSNQVVFHQEYNPFQLLEELKSLLEKHEVHKGSFTEVVVIHRNNLFSLVPEPLFEKEELANYLKFNAKILANDLLAYDEIDGHEFVNVYVPFVNINNYIYDLFGEFVYKHHGTVMVQSLLNENYSGKIAGCYVYITDHQIDVTVIVNKKLLLYNNFDYTTEVDFLYYLLFTLEQLQLDPESVELMLFGKITEEDSLYSLCYEYIRNITIFNPNSKEGLITDSSNVSIDFTVLNAL